MKKLWILLALVLCLAPAVRADVIYTPEDHFFSTHECDYVNRSYFASGPEGEVVIYLSPESSVKRGRVSNGEVLGILYSYEAKEGTLWGYTEHEAGTGWVPMGYLTLRYDYISFQEEFAERIVYLDKYLKVEAGEAVRFWSYPGSDYSMELAIEPENTPEYGAYFEDDGGRRWGYVGYYYGFRNVWVYLEDPLAGYEELYAEIPPQTVTHPSAPVRDIVNLPKGPGMGIVLTAVAAVVLGSGAFLWLTRKKKA